MPNKVRNEDKEWNYFKTQYCNCIKTQCVLVTFLSLDTVHNIHSFIKGEVHFGSKFQKFQNLHGWQSPRQEWNSMADRCR